MAKVFITVSSGRVENVYAPPGTDVEVWNFDEGLVDPDRPDEIEIAAIVARHGLVDVL